MSTTASSHRSLLATYSSSTTGWDEMVDTDGIVRDHWTHLAGAMDTLGLDELAERRREVDRLLRDDGATHLAADAQDLDELWNLDPIPLVLPSDRWAEIERGIVQRGELLAAILRDLYGPRDLLERGVLPPEIVYGHRGFLRPCDGLRLPGSRQLPLYAADLVRTADGSFQVLGDRTETPSGFGYALENRSVLSRVFPSIYRDAQVHSLDGFFRSLRLSLSELAPPDVDDPTVVVLTPGRFNDAYFEHALLATHLGDTLVEGSDLTMRDGHIWLRALGGPQRVDVVLRRVDGWYCDPLELMPDSQLGVAGLLEVARRARVSIVNHPGAAVLENAALPCFLPAAAEALLGEPLLLESVPAWWCGDPAGRSHVLANLASLALRRISRGPARGAVFGWECSETQLADLAASIEADPNHWVGQQRIACSTMPTLTPSGFTARPGVLRSFAVAREGTWTVLPGGVARVADRGEGGDVIASDMGTVAKDTWVLASEPDKAASVWLADLPGSRPAEPAGAVPSRAAENLFWMGRYAERAEGVVRLVRVLLERRTQFAGRDHAAGDETLAALLAALASTCSYPLPDGIDAIDTASMTSSLRSVLLDADRRGSLASNVRAFLAAASTVRDQLSGDTWLVISNLERDLALLRSPVDADAAAQVAIGRVLKSLLAVAGLAHESMVRDAGWHFMDAGRRIERGLVLCRLLSATLTPARDDVAEALVLESALVASESIITYRRRYRSHARAETLLDLLLLDPTNPRSLAYQLDHLAIDVERMPRPARHRLDPDQRAVLEATTRLRLVDTLELAITDDHGRRSVLAEHLATTIAELEGIASAIDSTHFTHLHAGRLLVGEPHVGSETLGVVLR